ncbi:hypothetical protein SKAU_G00045750 [Synaphobranchus kaupii]|uniref:Uncharacterized protein n=1 Tax=Synaphobranchus kaupii TaxID=118154 RepID=A0A9Q1J993_SYNKA|nr:hypothetical protein SKAU_G00045750 [Synaphobranchus kaupii]
MLPPPEVFAFNPPLKLRARTLADCGAYRCVRADPRLSSLRWRREPSYTWCGVRPTRAGGRRLGRIHSIAIGLVGDSYAPRIRTRSHSPLPLFDRSCGFNVGSKVHGVKEASASQLTGGGEAGEYRLPLSGARGRSKKRRPDHLPRRVKQSTQSLMGQSAGGTGLAVIKPSSPPVRKHRSNSRRQVSFMHFCGSVPVPSRHDAGMRCGPTQTSIHCGQRGARGRWRSSHEDQAPS